MGTSLSGVASVPSCSISSRPSRRRWRRWLASLASPDEICARRRGRGAPREKARGERRLSMMRIYDVMIQLIVGLRPVVRRIERFDGDLVKQMRRAANSVALNMAEASGSSGGVRTQRYRTALGSARETWACLDVAEANGYVESVDAGLRTKLSQVIATLIKVTR